ncbi:hypothetical protein SERLA73DRAFT_121515 [Serpula lacrymans var. lacrymans S7.3]|uniref:Uncharacterized protein n=1 Tax=Serpula lacrymans var. lacrymans (strain S7.3) TaxID=936435 RepID=F8PRU5_SERL3|nr:hypothetical protein SERLA73DRAFT_121515 [Serpula lacrymans var. lacrymans S7.3]
MPRLRYLRLERGKCNKAVLSAVVWEGRNGRKSQMMDYEKRKRSEEALMISGEWEAQPRVTANVFSRWVGWPGWLVLFL